MNVISFAGRIESGFLIHINGKSKSESVVEEKEREYFAGRLSLTEKIERKEMLCIPLKLWYQNFICCVQLLFAVSKEREDNRTILSLELRFFCVSGR
jgi:tmRNA-binding protein